MNWISVNKPYFNFPLPINLPNLMNRLRNRGLSNQFYIKATNIILWSLCSRWTAPSRPGRIIPACDSPSSIAGLISTELSLLGDRTYQSEKHSSGSHLPQSFCRKTVFPWLRVSRRWASRWVWSCWESKWNIYPRIPRDPRHTPW